jgi:glutathione synthase
MDPIEHIKPYKDSTFAMLLEAQRRGYAVHVLTQSGLSLRDGDPWLQSRPVKVFDSREHWFEAGDSEIADAASFDFIFLRKDPPFDADYLYDTQILERAEARGVRVVNRPSGLRDANEKLFTSWFQSVCPPTLVSRRSDELKAFVTEHRQCVAKVLDAMGGASIFRVDAGDPNTNVIFETLTQEGRRAAMVQRYIPEITEGDKRILMINGQPVDYALARIPARGEFRGNLARGGTGRGQPLSASDRHICDVVGPELRRRGLWFVGLDVIGTYLTEVNVTSPTCIRELDSQFGLNIAGQLFDFLEQGNA